MKTRVFAVCAVIFLFYGIVNAEINDGLVAYYPFNGNANDESGNGNNGIANGAILTSDRFGNANKAYSFAGTNDNDTYINFGKPSILQLSNQITISAWFQFETGTANPRILSYGQDFGYELLIVTYTPYVNHIGFCWGGNIVYSNLVINISQWYHIVVTKNQNTISFYINGLLDSTASNTNIPSYTKDFNIGKKANHWDDHWGGKIDDIRIYNRAISETEIQQLYQGQGMCSNSIVTFTAGTPAKAADVNANFDAHNCQIQALKAIVCQDHPTASICQ